MQIAQSEKYKDNDWWDWAVWIDGTDEELNTIKDVVYTLHPTFYDPVRKVSNRRSKFKLETSGWGTFTIRANVVLKDGKNLPLKHELSLHYPTGEKTNSVLFKIENVEPRSSAEVADTLKQAIIEAAPDAAVTRKKTKNKQGDDTHGVSVRLAAPTRFSVAKGIQGWLSKNPQATLEVLKSGQSIAQNVNAGSIVKLLQSIKA